MAPARSQEKAKRIVDKNRRVIMNMEDYFKQSFDPSNFEFKEEYWQGAKQLLDKDSARRIMIKRVSLAACLLLFILSGTVLYLHTYHTVPTIITDEIQTEKNTHKIINNSQEAINNITGTKSYESTNTIADFNQTTEIDQENVTTTQPLLIEETNAYNPLATTEQKTNLSGKTIYIPNKSNRKVHDPSAPVSPLPEIDLPISEIANSTPDYLAEVPVTHYQIDLIPVNRKNKIKSQSDQFGFFESHPFAFGSFATGSFTAVTKSGYTTLIGTDILAFPNFSGSGVRYMGYGASVNQQIPVKNNVFLETGIGMNIQMGDFSPSIRSVHLSFDFGPRENSIVLNPNELYSIQVPLFIGFSMKAHQLSGGILASALTAVRGTHEYRAGILPWEPPAGNNFSQIQNGWLATDGFRNFLISYGMRYNVQVSRFLQLSLSAQYRPFDWIDEDFGSYYDLETMSYVRPASELTNPLRRNVIIGVGMRYSYAWKR